MATFPRTEAEEIQLAQDVSAGIRAHPDIFVNPPVSPDDMDKQIAQFKVDHDASVISGGKAKQGITAKNASLQTVVQSAKDNIKYAETITHDDAGKLQLIGWNARKARAPRTDSVPPDQVDVLAIVSQDKGTISLSWDAPPAGGLIAGYKIERQKADGTGAWQLVGTTTETTITLSGQDQGIAFIYQVIAFNKSGDAPPSNIVKATL
jgi:Fibronectin type III domain